MNSAMLLLNESGRWLVAQLGRMSMELAILAGVVLLALYVLRVKSPALRHLFWGLLLAKPVLTFLVASPLSLYVFLRPPTPEIFFVPPPAVVQTAQPLSPLPVAPPPEMAPTAVVPRVESPPFWRQVDRYGLAMLAWGLVASLLGLRLLLGCAYVAFLRGTARTQREGVLTDLVAGAAATLRVRRRVAIATTTVCHGPVLAGIFRPVILLPETMAAALTEAQLKLIITHELAHARRWDNLVLLVQRLAEMLFFFHPVVWCCGWMMRREAEAACDDMVVSAYGDAEGAGAAAYADSLTRVAEMKCGITRRLLVNTFAAAESNFHRRIRRILSGRRTRMTLWLSLATGAALILIGVLGLPAASAPKDTRKPDSTKNEAADGKCRDIDISGAEPRLREVLEKTVSTDFDDLHLAAALEQLNSKYGVNAAIDWRVVAPEKIRPGGWYDWYVRRQHDGGLLHNVHDTDLPLKNVLMGLAMLSIGNGTVEVGPNVVWITRKEMADSDAQRQRPSVEGASAAVKEALQKPATLDFKDLHLDQILPALSRVTSARIEVDYKVVPQEKDAGGAFNEKEINAGGIRYVSDGYLPYIHLTDVPVGEALEAILRSMSLTYRCDGDIIHITSNGGRNPVQWWMDFEKAHAAPADVYATPEGGYTHLVTFEPAGDFHPQTPSELLEVFNGVCKVRTGYFRTAPKDGKLVGRICTDAPQELRKSIEEEPRLTWVEAVPLTEELFAKHEASKQESLPEPAASAVPQKAEMVAMKLRVVDEKGAPVAGATVRPYALRTSVDPGSHYRWRPEDFGESRDTACDAQGDAQIDYPKYVEENKATDKVTVVVSHPEFVVKNQDLSVDEAAPVITLTRGTKVRVSGYIGSKENVAWPVHVLPDSIAGFTGHRWQENGKARENGQLTAGKQQLWLVHQPKDGPVLFSDLISYETSPDKVTELAVELHPGIRVEGRVDDTVPRPVRNGRVEIFVASMPPDETSDTPPSCVQYSAQALMGEDGRFVFDSLPKGYAEIAAWCDGSIVSYTGGKGNASLVHPLPVDLTAPHADIVVPMIATALATVRTNDTQGNPIEGIKVTCWPNIQWMGRFTSVAVPSTLTSLQMIGMDEKAIEAAYVVRLKEQPYTATTGPDGLATVTNLPPCTHQFIAANDAYQLPLDAAPVPRRRANIKLTPGANTAITVQLEVKQSTAEPAKEQPAGDGANRSAAYRTPEGGYTHLVTFESAGDFHPGTPKELLDVFNGVCRARTGYFRTAPKDGKLVGRICTDAPEELRKSIEKEPRLTWVEAVPLTEELFAKHEASKQESLPGGSDAKSGTAGFTADLRNGRTVALVSIRRRAPGDAAFWGPDGTPIPEAPYDPALVAECADSQGTGYEFAFRILGMKRGEPVRWHFDASPGWALADLAGMDGDLSVATVSLDPDATVASMKLLVASGGWQPLLEYQPGSKADQAGEGHSVVVGDPYEEEGDTCVTLRLDGGLAERAVRVVAGDREGSLYPAEAQQMPIGKLYQHSYRFSGLRLKDFKGFVLYTCPWRELRLENISLVSGTHTEYKVTIGPTADKDTVSKALQGQEWRGEGALKQSGEHIGEVPAMGRPEFPESLRAALSRQPVTANVTSAAQLIETLSLATNMSFVAGDLPGFDPLSVTDMTPVKCMEEVAAKSGGKLCFIARPYGILMTSVEKAGLIPGASIPGGVPCANAEQQSQGTPRPALPEAAAKALTRQPLTLASGGAEPRLSQLVESLSTSSELSFVLPVDVVLPPYAFSGATARDIMLALSDMTKERLSFVLREYGFLVGERGGVQWFSGSAVPDDLPQYAPEHESKRPALSEALKQRLAKGPVTVNFRPADFYSTGNESVTSVLRLASGLELTVDTDSVKDSFTAQDAAPVCYMSGSNGLLLMQALVEVTGGELCFVFTGDSSATLTSYGRGQELSGPAVEWAPAIPPPYLSALARKGGADAPAAQPTAANNEQVRQTKETAQQPDPVVVPGSIPGASDAKQAAGEGKTASGPLVVAPLIGFLDDKVKAEWQAQGVTGDMAVLGKLQDQTVEIMQKRLDCAGMHDVQVTKQANGRISVQIPPPVDAGRVGLLLTQPGMARLCPAAPRDEVIQAIQEIEKNPSFRGRLTGLLDTNSKNHFPTVPADKHAAAAAIVGEINDARPRLLPEGKMFFLGSKSSPDTLYLIDKNSPMANVKVNSASATPDTDNPGKAKISFSFSDEDAQRFGDLTQSLIGKGLAILVNWEVHSVPIVRSKITKSGQITGNYTMEEATDIVARISVPEYPAQLLVLSDPTATPATAAPAKVEDVRKALETRYYSGIDQGLLDRLLDKFLLPVFDPATGEKLSFANYDKAKSELCIRNLPDNLAAFERMLPYFGTGKKQAPGGSSGGGASQKGIPEDFERGASGVNTWPDGWVADGNASNHNVCYVDGTTFKDTHGNTLRLQGDTPAWSPLAHFMTNVNVPFQIAFDVYLESKDPKCTCVVGVRKEPSWKAPGVILFDTIPPGGVNGLEPVAEGGEMSKGQTFEQLHMEPSKWYHVELAMTEEGGRQTLTATLNDGTNTQGPVQVSADALVKDMPYLQLEVRSGTAWFDNVSMLPVNPAHADPVEPHPGKVTGLVKDLEGKPVADAYVGVGDTGDSGGSNHERHRQEGIYATGRTDNDGRFLLDGLALRREHLLFVTHPDYVRDDRKLTLDGEQPSQKVEFTLRSAARINVSIGNTTGNDGRDAMRNRFFYRLEALDGEKFVQPGRDPHLLSFASNVWIATPPDTDFSFSELDAGKYRVEALGQFPILNMTETPLTAEQLEAALTAHYYGEAPSLAIKNGETADVPLQPMDNGTRLRIGVANSPGVPANVPRLLWISRDLGLLEESESFDSPENAQFGRGWLTAVYCAQLPGHLFVGDEGSHTYLTITNLPPGKYCIFTGHIAGVRGTLLDLQRGECSITFSNEHFRARRG